jgi:hypothetical protein
MMEAVHTSEMSVYSNETTRRYNPDGSHLLTRRRENMNSRISSDSTGRNNDIYRLLYLIFNFIVAGHWACRTLNKSPLISRQPATETTAID